MDFEYTREQDTFRKEFRGWLAANLPADLRVDDPVDERVASRARCSSVAWVAEGDAQGGLDRHRVAQEYGGRNASIIERVIWDEEYRRRTRGAARHGLNLVGPPSSTGKRRAEGSVSARILTPTRSGRRDSRSPARLRLASLRTRAETRAITSSSTARGVDPARSTRTRSSCSCAPIRAAQAQRHLVPARGHEAPGVSVRPLVLATGHTFNEVFFTDVMVPKSQLLGR